PPCSTRFPYTTLFRSRLSPPPGARQPWPPRASCSLRNGSTPPAGDRGRPLPGFWLPALAPPSGEGRRGVAGDEPAPLLGVALVAPGAGPGSVRVLAGAPRRPAAGQCPAAVVRAAASRGSAILPNPGGSWNQRVGGRPRRGASRVGRCIRQRPPGGARASLRCRPVAGRASRHARTHHAV